MLRAPEECAVVRPLVIKERGRLRAGELDIFHAGLLCGLGCKRDRFGAEVDRDNFFYGLCHCDRDLPGTAAYFQNGVCAAESEILERDCHDLVLGRAAGEFCAGHLEKIWRERVLRVVLGCE